MPVIHPLRLLLLCSLVVVTSNTVSTIADEMPIVNRTLLPLKVYFWDGEKKEWLRPPLGIRPGEQATFNYRGNGRYYLVARTRTFKKRERILGWVDFRKLTRRNEAATFAIDGHFIMKQREITYTVRRPVKEIKLRKKTEYRRERISGVWRWVPKVVIEEYEVTKYVAEQRTRIVNERTLDLVASARVGNAPLLSSVTFKTQPNGAFVVYRLAGRDQANTADNPTNSIQSLPVGMYVIWADRNGTITSKKRAYDIYQEQRTITIQENSPEG